jgi:hypothetical protein
LGAPTHIHEQQVTRPTTLFAAVAAAGHGCGRADGLDTKLSTELVNARFTVLEWPPPPGSTTPPETQPEYTKCGLRLRDGNTGTVYVLSRSTKQEPADGAGGPSTWPEQGDYSVHPSGAAVAPGGGTHLVRIECGPFKVLGLVEAKRLGR